jgi:PERQ amino acid-rich with GYF domain-containing protein
MRQWLEAGYFKGDLPISQRSDGPFHTLSTLFPDISIAFKPTAPSEEKITGAKFVEKEMVHESIEQVIEVREVVEQEEEAVTESKTKTDEVITISSTNQNQSDQLKMLLGLGGSQDEQKPEKKMSIAGPPVKTESKMDEEGKDSQFQNKSSETKLYKRAPDVSSTSTPAPAWGGAGAGKSLGRKKSMSEIQKEEATVAARLAKHKVSSNANSSSGWANIAKSGGTTAWSGNTVVSSTKTPNTSNSSSIHGVSNANNPSSRVKQQVSSMSQAQGLSQRTSTQQTMEEFGANEKMTPSLESWCKEQMRKLSDNDDLTLVAFCMTLADPGEIKQYLTAYLGSTPQVHSFAAEFINRKSGTQKQEEWETTSSNKKGRKKKGGLLAK